MAPVAADSETQWPPRSPREALLSTPGGRQRYREMLNRTSPSPSPSRMSRLAPALADNELRSKEDEDEETLELQLQEIQARLKLKKLQNAKAKDRLAAEGGAKSAVGSTTLTAAGRLRAARSITPGADQGIRPGSQNSVQVPVSPVRRVQEPQQQRSPSRVLLGIDKGLTAKDISLKRAPSLKKTQGTTDAAQHGGFLRRSRTPNPATLRDENVRPMSFNERLASVRTEETSLAERQERIRKMRTNAFGIGKSEMESYKTSAVEIPDEPLQSRTFTRDEVVSQAKPFSGGALRRSNTVPNVRSATNESEGESSSIAGPSSLQGESASSFDSYSGFHLSRRILPHTVLTRHVSGKKLYTVKDLLKQVKSPDFALPDVEQDIVVFAIVANKSKPRAHKPGSGKKDSKDEDRGKYMVISLVDFDFEVDLFLFNSGFTRFWQLTEGTVIALLNPGIMPPPPGKLDTGRFSLVINSDEDTIIEIGMARDLGFCQSVKKDGDTCNSWVNKRKTQFCEYHANEAVRKQRSTRMEVNGTGFGGRKKNSKDKSREWYFDKKKDHNENYDWETRTQWFSARSMSAADLIDGKDLGPSHRKEKAEFVKRNIEAKERERDMMKKLGRIGNSAGREYMEHAGSKVANGPSSSSAQGPGDAADDPDKPNVKPLGLRSKDHTIHLSPVKRKWKESSQVGQAASLGWGTDLKGKLARMKDGEKLRKEEEPPVRKKTRFVTEKGIREAGRESLGMDLAGRQVSLEDDDDELVIVR